MSLLSKVTKQAPPLPSRVVLYAGEKFGKTSFATNAPKPIFLMSAGETGLLSLIEAGRVRPTDHFPEDFKTWDDLRAATIAVLKDDHEFQTLVIDTANGAESLCSKHICEKMYSGSWADYQDYGKGDVNCAKEWAEYLRLLDEVRVRRRMAIILLHHARVKQFSNPSGKDWDQWKPECLDKCWALTHKWSDVILFGGFKVNVVKEKATGETRYLRANASAAIIAGNRYGLPDEITSGAGSENLWNAFAGALRKAKSAGSPQTPPPATNDQPPAEQPPEASKPDEPIEVQGAEAPPATTESPPSDPPPSTQPQAAPPVQPAPEAAPPAQQPPAQQTPPPATNGQPLAKSKQQQILDLLHAANMAWHETSVKFRAGEIIGRSIEPSAPLSCLTDAEADRFIDSLSRMKADREAKAEQRRKTVADRREEKPVGAAA